MVWNQNCSTYVTDCTKIKRLNRSATASALFVLPLPYLLTTIKLSDYNYCSTVIGEIPARPKVTNCTAFVGHTYDYLIRYLSKNKGKFCATVKTMILTGIRYDLHCFASENFARS